MKGAIRVGLAVSLICSSMSAYASVSASAVGSAPVLKLNPQVVEELTLTKGLRAKEAELEEQRSRVVLYRALGEFDLRFLVTPGFEHNQAQTLSGTSNVIDKTFTLQTGVFKKFRYGTTLGVELADIRQTSVLNASSGGARLPNANLRSAQLSVRQALSRNAFGYADRLAVAIGEDTVTSAKAAKAENLEAALLEAMTLFWSAYTAEQQLKEMTAAREKYDDLVRNVRRKAGFQLATPGEVPRLEAEREAADQRVKTAQASYQNSIDALLTALQIRPAQAIELDVPKDLPPAPKLAEMPLESLRTVRIAETALRNAERDLMRAHSQTRPRLDLVARGKTTGVDDEPGVAFTEMTSMMYPTAFIGIEFETPFGSDLFRGQMADAIVQAEQSQIRLQRQRDSTRDALWSLERLAQSQHSVASSGIEIVEKRSQVVRELETAYRQGRQPLIELIRAYNELFNAQIERARAVGQYHVTLNQLAAARDELVSAAHAD
jgi:outer membrane protein TolC